MGRPPALSPPAGHMPALMSLPGHEPAFDVKCGRANPGAVLPHQRHAVWPLGIELPDRITGMSCRIALNDAHITRSPPVRAICPDRKSWFNCRHANPAQRQDGDAPASEQCGDGDPPAANIVIG